MATRPRPGSEEVRRRLAELEKRLESAHEGIVELRAEYVALKRTLETTEPGEDLVRSTPGASRTGEVPTRPSTPGPAEPPPLPPRPPPGPSPQPDLERAPPRAASAKISQDSDALPVLEPFAEETEARPPRPLGSPRDSERARGLPETCVPAPESDTRALDLETRIGQVWFLRTGLVALVIGFVFFAYWVHPQMERWHKVACGYLASAALFAFGCWFEGKLRQFARPVMAGGLSLGFFTSFAAGYLKNTMACVSEEISLGLMSASVLAILLCATLWRSQVIAVVALFLGHLAANAAAGEQDVFSLSAILILSAGALVLFLVQDWPHLASFGVAAAFVSHGVWAIQEHPVTTPETQFWSNFSFFSAYYVLFLAADLVFQPRVKRAPGRYGTLERWSGRSAGPLALILYATSATVIYHQTQVYWESIHLYLFGLAAVEAAVGVYHRILGSRESPFHAAAATLLVTLGLFSWLGGLDLNLALGAEALLLLVLARSFRLWFLRPLSLGVLAVDFVHFWLSSTHRPTEWPLFLGGSASAAVYLIAARLEETWRTLPADEALSESAWIGAVRRFFGSLATPLSFTFAVTGAWLLAHLSQGFFLETLHVPADGAAIAAFASLVLVAVLTLRSVSLLVGLWTLEAACCVLLLLHWSGGPHIEALLADVPGRHLWLIDQSGAAALALGSCVAFEAARIWRQGFFRIVGVGGLALAAPALFLAAAVGEPALDWAPLWLVGPLVLWTASEAWSAGAELSDPIWSPGGLGAAERWLEARRGSLGPLLAVAGAVVTVRVVCAVLPLADDLKALWILSAATPFLLAFTVWRASVALLLGLLTHLALVTCVALALLSDVAQDGSALSWFLVAGPVLVGSTLALVAPWRRRGSFALASLGALLCALCLLGMFLSVSELSFSPFPLWLGIALGPWIAIETLRFHFPTPGTAPAAGWRDQVGLGFVRAPSVQVIGSLGAATILVGVICRHFDSDVAQLIAMVLSGSAFLLCAARLRSPSLAAGYAIFLTASYVAYVVDFLPLRGVDEHPALTLLLVTVALAAGVAVESVGVRRPSTWDSSRRAWAGLGAWHAYALGFALGGWLAHRQGGALFSVKALGFSAQALLSLAAFGLGWGLRLGWLQLAAFAAATVAAATAVMDATGLFPGYSHEGRLLSGLVASAALMGMERIAAWQKAEILGRVGSHAAFFVRSSLVLGGSGLMLVVLSYSEGVSGTLTTLGWSVTGLVLMALGFLWGAPLYRRTALAVFGSALVRVVVVDVAKLDLYSRMIAFLSLGACLIAASFLYSRFQDQIRRWF